MYIAAAIGTNERLIPALKALQDGWQVRPQSGEIGRIIGAIREFDIETALRFAKGVVFLAV